MGLSLFSDEDILGQGNQEEDNTEIKMTLLYYNQKDYKEFKRLSKKAIELHYGENRFKDGNISDILLTVLKKEYGEDI